MDDHRINGTHKNPSGRSDIDEFIKESKEVDHSDGEDGEEVRERAREILRIYNGRLKEEGEKSFQVRLNIFFTFVRDNSVEAEAYDMIQSVEGSVLNHDSVIIEEDDADSTVALPRSRQGSLGGSRNGPANDNIV